MKLQNKLKDIKTILVVIFLSITFYGCASSNMINGVVVDVDKIQDYELCLNDWKKPPSETDSDRKLSKEEVDCFIKYAELEIKTAAGKNRPIRDMARAYKKFRWNENYDSFDLSKSKRENCKNSTRPYDECARQYEENKPFYARWRQTKGNNVKSKEELRKSREEVRKSREEVRKSREELRKAEEGLEKATKESVDYLKGLYEKYGIKHSKKAKK